jgi:hypothetical protein
LNTEAYIKQNQEVASFLGGGYLPTLSKKVLCCVNFEQHPACCDSQSGLL